jgi:hypothetical protein
MTDQLLTAALAAAGRGWHIFPLVPDGKRPAVRDWEARATTDPGRIERCWTTGTPYNIGLACGPSGLVVLDLDVAKPGEPIPAEYAQCGFRSGGEVLADLQGVHGDIPDTLMIATPSGGEHWYFTAPAGQRLYNTAGRLGWKIDTRSAGGYVVAPGSVIGGVRYAVVADLPPAPLPGWIADQIRRDPAGHMPAPLPVDQRRRAEYVAAAVHGELARVLSPRNLAARNIGPGEHGPGRNTDLFKAASQLGQLVATGDLDHAVVFAALTTAGQAIGLDASEAAKTVASGLRNGMSKPRQPALGVAVPAVPSVPAQVGPGTACTPGTAQAVPSPVAGEVGDV